MANTSWGDRECHMLYVLQAFFSFCFFQKRLYIKYTHYIYTCIHYPGTCIIKDLLGKTSWYIYFLETKIQSYFLQHQVCIYTSNPMALFIVEDLKFQSVSFRVPVGFHLSKCWALLSLCVSVDEHPRNSSEACSNLFFPQYLSNTG